MTPSEYRDHCKGLLRGDLVQAIAEHAPSICKDCLITRLSDVGGGYTFDAATGEWERDESLPLSLGGLDESAVPTDPRRVVELVGFAMRLARKQALEERGAA